MSGPKLPLDQALLVAEAVRNMAMQTRFSLCGSRRLPDCLHGSRQSGTKGDKSGKHPHAFWLPEDVDENGCIDHILVFAHAGIDRAGLTTLMHCHQLSVNGLGSCELMLKAATPQGHGPLCGRSKIWHSRTPCYPNLHDKNLETCIRRELKRRGLPDASRIETHQKKIMLAGSSLHVNAFHCQRHNGNRPPGGSQNAAFVELEFATPITGPLTLGFASHFGLGQFAPVKEK